MVEAVPASGWVAGPIITTDMVKLKVSGVPVIIRAECLFTMASHPYTQSLVILTPLEETRLKVESHSLLLVDDEKIDTYGNKLKIKSGQTILKCDTA